MSQWETGLEDYGRKEEDYRGVWVGWIIRFDLGARIVGARGESTVWGDPLQGAVL